MGNPRFIRPNDELQPIDSPELSLAEQLGGLVDDARTMLSELGLRPYRVWLVTVRWAGGEIGVGEPIVLSEREFLPTPYVDTRPLSTELKSGGRTDNGFLRLTEISPRYTEDEIWGLFDAANGEQVFIEIRIDERDGKTERRRFVVRGQPWRDAENFQWVVSLSTEQQARTRDGVFNEQLLDTYPERGRV